MKNMTLKHIAECCSGTYYGDEKSLHTEVAGIATDSRKVKKGGLFVPILGSRVDGHSFIPQVMQAGALAVLSEQAIEDAAGPYILVDSTLAALRKMAAFYRQSLNIPVVGITGSVGKTSTKEMIASVLKEKYNVHKTIKNFNNEIGLPLTVFEIEEEHEISVLEMGISDFGEMHRLAEIANPDICVITNIGLCHLENLGSRDGILKAKTEAFEHLRGKGVVILNGDDDQLASIQEVNGQKPVFYTLKSQKRGAAYATEIMSLGLEGVRMMLHLDGKAREVTIPIPGEHNIYNALAAACVGNALGMDLDEICRGIESARTIDGRSNLIKKDRFTIIDDCYNANPVSMQAALDVLSHAPGRKIAILGDMGELGERERELHAGVGKYAAEKKIDRLYCTGRLCKDLVSAAKEASGNFKGNSIENSIKALHFDTKEALAESLCADIQKGDTLLVKASHFMEFTKIVEILTALS